MDRFLQVVAVSADSLSGKSLPFLLVSMTEAVSVDRAQWSDFLSEVNVCVAESSRDARSANGRVGLGHEKESPAWARHLTKQERFAITEHGKDLVRTNPHRRHRCS